MIEYYIIIVSVNAQHYSSQIIHIYNFYTISVHIYINGWIFRGNHYFAVVQSNAIRWFDVDTEYLIITPEFNIPAMSTEVSKAQLTLCFISLLFGFVWLLLGTNRLTHTDNKKDLVSSLQTNISFIFSLSLSFIS